MRVKFNQIYSIYFHPSLLGGLSRFFLIVLVCLWFQWLLCNSSIFVEYTSHIIAIYPKGCPLCRLKIVWVPIGTS